ncbi:hypothetical protein FF011L_02710 [Roseimaritima multifibrata]|uniref:Uncharacterized protein n=1 Tax=Roseimaritima multifibrata TaxID=1930274 RepID=A0A517M9M9_9BACT|nr:hypothetical protein FF011L_02710 [Roseimaritima multifibrata]
MQENALFFEGSPQATEPVADPSPRVMDGEKFEPRRDTEKAHPFKTGSVAPVIHCEAVALTITSEPIGSLDGGECVPSCGGSVNVGFERLQYDGYDVRSRNAWILKFGSEKGGHEILQRGRT